MGVVLALLLGGVFSTVGFVAVMLGLGGGFLYGALGGGLAGAAQLDRRLVPVAGSLGEERTRTLLKVKVADWGKLKRAEEIIERFGGHREAVV